LHSHTKADTLYAVGNQIWIGKESDIFAVADASGTQYVLKIHRLGRISFRRVRNTRDYLRKRGGTRPSGGSIWMHMSRLAALKEHTFMAALHEAGFPVPKPMAHNRHTVVMELIEAFPLRKIAKVPDPASLYAELMDIIIRLASVGLIHCDFNEFNILIREDPVEPKSSGSEPTVRPTPILIDFPQMVSISHTNAKMYFDRDVACIKQFFERRFGFVSDASGPTFEEATARIMNRIDVAVEASGFSKKMAKELESYMEEVGVDGDRGSREHEEEDDESEEDTEHEEQAHDDEKVPQRSAEPVHTTESSAPGEIGNDSAAVSTAPSSSIRLSSLQHGISNLQIDART
jgi:RIO kinase 2